MSRQIYESAMPVQGRRLELQDQVSRAEKVSSAPETCPVLQSQKDRLRNVRAEKAGSLYCIHHAVLSHPAPTLGRRDRLQILASLVACLINISGLGTRPSRRKRKGLGWSPVILEFPDFLGRKNSLGLGGCTAHGEFESNERVLGYEGCKGMERSRKQRRCCSIRSHEKKSG